MTMEGRGIPTATFVTHAFDSYARGLCHMQAMESLPIVVMPHPIAARPVDDLRQKVRKVHADLRAALINHA